MPEAEVIVVEAPSAEVVPEPPVIETPDVPADEAAPAPTEETKESEAKKESKFQRRLDRQKDARIAAEARANLLEEQLAKATQRQAPLQNAPTRDQYGSDEEYIEARATWRAEAVAIELVEKRLKERDDRDNSTKQQQYEAAREGNWQKREEIFSDVVPDYSEVTDSAISEANALHMVTRIAIAESELGPNLLYYFGKNTDEFDRLASLSPQRQLVEIGKLEDKVSKSTPVKASKAPDPIKPVGGKASIEPDLDDITKNPKLFAAWREKHIKARS